MDTSSMWLRREENHNTILDKTVFNSNEVYFKIYPWEGHLENIELNKELYRNKYKIRGEEYYTIDGKIFGPYDSITLPVCFVKADAVIDNQKDQDGKIKGTLVGVLRQGLDDNNHILDQGPEFHFYLAIAGKSFIGHSTEDVQERTIHMNLASIDPDILNRLKHIYSRKNPNIIPQGFVVKTYHGEVRRENFSRGIFVTNLEQNKQ